MLKKLISRVFSISRKLSNMHEVSTNDFVFKSVFGNAENSSLLVNLINSIISPKDRVASVQLLNTALTRDYPESKSIILDILCETSNEKLISIELQRSKQGAYQKRALHY